MRRLKRVVDAVLTVATSILLVCLLLTVTAGLFGYRAYAIRSGSMVPVLPIGSLVIDREIPPLDLVPGDLVTFQDTQLGKQLVTHRIQQLLHINNRLYVITKGDANLSTERWNVPVTTNLGHVVAEAPVLGRVLLESETPHGRVIEVIVVFTWVAYLVLRWAWNATRASNELSKRASGVPTEL